MKNAARGFLSGLLTGGDGNASMAKTMAWITFIMILVGWFFFPEKPLDIFLTMFGLLLGYALGGKASFNFSGQAAGKRGKRKPENVQP